jgi:hypothetical protein
VTATDLYTRASRTVIRSDRWDRWDHGTIHTRLVVKHESFEACHCWARLVTTDVQGPPRNEGTKHMAPARIFSLPVTGGSTVQVAPLHMNETTPGVDRIVHWFVAAIGKNSPSLRLPFS